MLRAEVVARGMPKVHQPIYREVLRQTWIVVSKNKFLWVLGFFASFLANVGVYDVMIRGLRNAVSRGVFSSSLLPGDALGLGTISIPIALLDAGGPLPIVFPAMLVVAILVAVFVWLAVTSQVGIMHATAKIIKGGSSNLKEASRIGANFFWPVLGINLVSKFLASALLMGISYPVFLVLSQGGVLSSALYFLLFLLLVPGALIVSFLGLFSSAGMVAKKQEMLPAVKNAWIQFTKHYLPSLEMALLLLGLGVLLAIGTLLLMLVASVPLVVLAIVAGLFAGPAGASFVLMIAFAVMLAILVVAASGFTAYQISAWTILYLRFMERGAVAKVVRLFSQLPQYLAPKRR